MGVYSPAQHWHRVEGTLAKLGEEGTRVTRDNTSVSLVWVMEDISAEGKQLTSLSGSNLLSLLKSQIQIGDQEFGIFTGHNLQEIKYQARISSTGSHIK